MAVMLSSVPRVLLVLSVLLYLGTSLPAGDEDEGELESFPTERRRLKAPCDVCADDARPELALRQSRRQLGDIEFSNRYAEFLRSKAKHTSICAFLRRMQGVSRSSRLLGDTEKVKVLMKQFMCPTSVLSWPSDL